MSAEWGAGSFSEKRLPFGVERKRAVDIVDDAIFWGLLAGLAIAPFWFGGNRALSWTVNAIWSCGLLALYEIRVLWQGGVRPVAARLVWPAVLAFVTVLGWSLAQNATWTPARLHHPIWGVTREALHLNVPGSISVNREATDLAILRLVTAASVFWLALQLGRSALRARWLVQAVALLGGAYALYGIVAFFVFPGTMLWLEKTSYLDALTSTFVNRNSYATYAAMGLIAAVGITLSVFAMNAARGTATRQFAGFIANLAGPAGIWMAISIVIAMALIMTGSRGGISSALLGLLVGMTLIFLQGRGRRTTVAVSALLATVLVLSVGAAFGDLLASRLVEQGFRSDERLIIYRTTLLSIADRPLVGFGYGTFDAVFPLYRDASTVPFLRWDKAHNTYLEVVQGLGLPVALIFFWGVGFLIWRCFLGTLTRRRSITPPLVASAASVTVLAHSLVDFSLQIQGVALTWVALLGSGVAQSWSSEMNTSLA